ncbi:MAG: hypothetical protein DRO67_09730 [Candidatus Asgardarchaeum californiense]|nr:MAG: hypothetical protein DRO67_09730 [Candidatus Asgardarchaeum californiense]
MPINKKEEERLLHDIKRLAIGIQLIADENNNSKRKYLANLLDAELKRLVEDIEDILENGHDK